jgi:cytochrome c556
MLLSNLIAPQYKDPVMRAIDRSLGFSMLLAATGLLAACGNGAEGPAAGGPAVDEESPEYQAYAYRHGLMTVIGSRLGILRGMATGDVPVDNERFVKAAADMAVLATLVREGFPEGSDVPGSRALPEIWTDPADFDNKIQDFEAAAAALADTAEAGGFAAAQGSVDGLAQSCGACHRPYRAPEE